MNTDLHNGNASDGSVDVFNYEDPSAYLLSVLADLKKRKQIRLVAFAKDAGIGSASLLSMISKGKRKLSFAAAEKIAKALLLKGKEKKYFLAMQRLQNSRSTNERIEAREEMIRLKNKVEPTLFNLEQYRFVGTWYYPVIYVLSGMKNMDWDPKSLARRLGKKVTPKQIELALSELCKLGILKFEENRYVRAIFHPTTAEDLLSAATQSYHQQMGQMAIEALQDPMEEREMNGLTVAIPKAQLATIKDKIRKFRTELNEMLAPAEMDSEDVYQINLHLFRLTKDVQTQEEEL